MDYTALTIELIKNMQALRKIKPHKNINEALHGESFVLHYIASSGGDVLPGDISSEMCVSSARIAAALNSLENKGLITRQIDTSDRRKILVGITPEGRALEEKNRLYVVEEASKMLAMLGEHDANEYVRITGRLAELVSKLQ